MRLFALVSVAALFSTSALAQEIITPTPPQTGSPFWNFMSYVFAVILVPIVTVLAKMALDWQAKLAAEKDKTRADLREKLRYEAESILARIASNLANSQLVELRKAAVDGKVSKEELKKLGEKAIAEAKEEFSAQGVDISRKLSEKALESMLRNQVDKLNAK